MGDLGSDTAVERVGDGCFTAVLSKDWEIWGPHGRLRRLYGSAGGRRNELVRTTRQLLLPLPRSGFVSAPSRSQ